MTGTQAKQSIRLGHTVTWYHLRGMVYVLQEDAAVVAWNDRTVNALRFGSDEDWQGVVIAEEVN